MDDRAERFWDQVGAVCALLLVLFLCAAVVVSGLQLLRDYSNQVNSDRVRFLEDRLALQEEKLVEQGRRHAAVLKLEVVTVGAAERMVAAFGLPPAGGSR
jgi:hypothetical protein